MALSEPFQPLLLSPPGSRERGLEVLQPPGPPRGPLCHLLSHAEYQEDWEEAGKGREETAGFVASGWLPSSLLLQNHNSGHLVASVS